jgi:hypothetical protein
MVASTLQQPTRGWFDVLDDWLKQVVPAWGTLGFCGAPRSLRSYRFYAQAV